MYINVQATTVVFHQFETGLREGTIYTKVPKYKKAIEVNGSLREAFL